MLFNNYTMNFNEYTIIAFIIGFFVGVFITFVLNKQDITLEKSVSIILIFFWISINTIAFLLNKEMSWVFDILGAGAAGHLIGLDITLLLSKILKK